MAAQPTGAHPRSHPFAQALRQAIDARGTTLTGLHRALAARGTAVSMATLSSWRSGERHPEGARSMAAVAEIERVLGLPEGALAGLVGSSRRIGRVSHPSLPWDEALQSAVLDVHDELGCEFPPPTRELSVHSVCDVGPAGGIAVRRLRLLVQSVSGVVAELPILEVMPWVAIPAPTFRVLSGGRISRVASHPSGRVHGAAVELAQPLTPGATTVLEAEIAFSPDGPPLHETGQAVGRSIRELLLWIRFAPGKLPEWCQLVELLPDQPPVVQPLPLDRGGAGHVVRRGFGPGAVGVHWGYDGGGAGGLLL